MLISWITPVHLDQGETCLKSGREKNYGGHNAFPSKNTLTLKLKEVVRNRVHTPKAISLYSEFFPN